MAPGDPPDRAGPGLHLPLGDPALTDRIRRSNAFDATNAPDPWQGSIRFGTLDAWILARAIAGDLSDAGAVRVLPSLSVTCLDQARSTVPVRIGAETVDIAPVDAAARLSAAAGIPEGLSSWGPTRLRLEGHRPRRSLAA